MTPVPGGSTVHVGNHNDSITVFGNGTVFAGNGNDTVNILGKGIVDIGHGGSRWHLANMAAAEAVWGREQEARRHGLEALEQGQRSGSIFREFGV